MAKKKLPEVKISTTEEITLEKVILLSKEKGYNGIDSIYEIQGWIRNNLCLHAEIFFSMFHKKWSINNYFIDTLHGKKVEWKSLSTMFESHDDALIVALFYLLNI